MWTEGESHGQPQNFAVAIGLFVMPLLFSVAPVHAIAGAVSMLASFALFFGGSSRNNLLGIMGAILIMILAPLAAALVQMAISRTRKYAADAGGNENCGNPLWLANGLDRMERGAASIGNQRAEANPVTAHMFIIYPCIAVRSIICFRPTPIRPIASNVCAPWPVRPARGAGAARAPGDSLTRELSPLVWRDGITGPQ